jgi:glycosyltransferase involved in cell wall biosynthesis
MLGTFAMKPKGTMSARAAGLAAALNSRGWDIRIATVPWDNPDEAGRRYSLNGVPVVNTAHISPNLAPFAVRELLSIANAFKPDLVHLFKPKGFGDLAARILRLRGTPVLVDMDDWEGDGGWNDRLPYSTIQRRVFQWQETSWPRMANGVTVASRALEQYALDLGSSPDKVLYLPNMLTGERVAQLDGPNLTTGDRYPSLKTDDPANRVLLYTRFVETTPEFILDFLHELVTRRRGVNLVVAGRSSNGTVERRIRAAAESAGVADRIDWLGWIDPADLGWITRQCDVALVPFDDSLINRAKCSIKLLELLATGIPVVASSVGENREYILRFGGGLLARQGDVEEHVDRTLELLGSGSTRESRRRDRDMTWNLFLSQVEELYSRTLPSHPFIP